jgi:hypothetical protein
VLWEVKSKDARRRRKRTLWKQNGAKSLDSADKHPQLLRVPHVVAPFVKFLEVTMRTGEADAGWTALESVELTKETSGEWLRRNKNEKEGDEGDVHGEPR